MSISYQPKDDRVQQVQLKVQELCLKLSDSNVIVAVGDTVVVQVGEPVAAVRSVLHCDDSVPGAALIAQSAIAIGTPSGGVANSQLTINLGLGNAMAANDSLIVKYVVAE